MSCLDATFTLTPTSPTWGSANSSANLWCYGAAFWPGTPSDFSSLYSTNRFFFDPAYASDPNLDYSQWPNRLNARFLETSINIAVAPYTRTQLILIFGFDTYYGGRVLVYSDAARLADQELLGGDSQFAIEVDSLNQPLNLYFIHAGGSWFFKGISGYLV